MRKLNPNIRAHVPTEPEVKLAMIRKLEAELRNFKTDSEGTRSNLENAIKDLSSKLNEDNVRYLPRLVKSRRNHVVHLNTKALIFARSHLWKTVCGLLQFKLWICGWRCWHGDVQQMFKCRAKQRGDWCRMTTCSVANWMPGWTLAARLWDLWTSAALQSRAELWGWAWLDLNITWHEECRERKAKLVWWTDGQKWVSWPAVLAQSLARDILPWRFPHLPTQSGAVWGGWCGMTVISVTCCSPRAGCDWK